MSCRILSGSGIAGFVVLLVMGVGACSQSPAPPVQVEAPERAEVGDSIYVELRLGEPYNPDSISSLTFVLHYNNAFMEITDHTPGGLAREQRFRGVHAPSNAELEFSVVPEGGADRTLVAVKGRITHPTPDGVPARLLVSDVEVVREGGVTSFDESGYADLTLKEPQGYDPGPQVSVGNQYTLRDTVRIRRVVTDAPGWVVLQAEQSGIGDPNAAIGRTWVEEGVTEEIKVALDEEFGLDDRVFAELRAVLHRDEGEEQEFEYAGRGDPDAPVRIGEAPVHQEFSVLYADSDPGARIVVRDQAMKGHGIVVDSVIASEPANLVVHRNRGNSPFVPGVIGRARVGAGVNTDVRVDLFDHERVICGERLWPMLHVRTESEDQPYEIDYPIITEPVIIECG